MTTLEGSFHSRHLADEVGTYNPECPTCIASLGLQFVYIVCSGEYSDRAFHCVCMTKADAEAITAVDPELWIGKVMLCDANVTRTLYLELRAKIYDDGRESQEPYERQTAVWPWSWRDEKTSVEWRWHRWKTDDFGDLMVEGTDFERVRKTFGELRARLHEDDVFRSQDHAHG